MSPPLEDHNLTALFGFRIHGDVLDHGPPPFPLSTGHTPAGFVSKAVREGCDENSARLALPL